jgi:predicted RNA-binding Zn ribbon-like protein
MLRVTWEWIGAEPALDIANTIGISGGDRYDLLEPAGEFDRWATEAEKSPALSRGEAGAIRGSRSRILALRQHIRDVLFAVAAGEKLPGDAVAELNRASRRSPTWPEVGDAGRLAERSAGTATDRLLAEYARSAMQIVVDGAAHLRVCPAPSCGMFFRPRRTDQHWCSVQCGSRARVARHYAAHKSKIALPQNQAVARRASRRGR